MTSHQGKCDLSSLLPMSCHQRAQAFADRLRSRLTSLDSEDLNGVPHETSWLTTHKDAVALSQPKHNSDFNLTTNFYLNLVSPASPVDETDNITLTQTYQNKDDLVSHVVTSQYDSDSSDGPFYDCQGDLTLTKLDLRTQNHNDKDTTESKCENHITVVDTDEKVVTNGVEKLSLHNSEPHSNKLRFENGAINFASCESLNGEISSKNHLGSELLNGSAEENESDERIPRVRRCSSLKTGKTPPGTPGRKKIVRFADVFGLDLADVRTYLDEIPKIPNSAFNDLVDVDIKPSESDLVLNSSLQILNAAPEKILVPLFQQPGSLPNFIDRLRDNHVCLECALVEDPTTCLIRGIVRVKNLDFHKTVHVRYTFDSWLTFTDVQALYMENTCDGFSDRFSFMLYANNVLIGEKIEFAVRFQCKGCQFWDNNNGINYIFQSLPGTSNCAAIAITALDDSLATFY